MVESRIGAYEELIRDEVARKLVKVLRPAWAIGHALSLLGWDSETYMPRLGAVERSIAVGELSVLSQKIILGDEVKRLLEEAEKRIDSYNEYERGLVRVVRRERIILEKLPPEHVYEMSMITQQAVHVWKEAREKSDFNLFKPYLEKIVELARKTAEYLGYEEHPYNALLDLYEEGLRIRDMDRVFDTIIPHSKRILEEVRSSGYYPERHPLEQVEYDRARMEEANKRVLDLLRFPWDRARLDVSPHPFTTEMGVNDVRITTRYEGRDFKRTLYSVVHEFGHALYELQQDPRLATTPLVGGVSLGVHESQSRFWENIVGRSPWFLKLVKPILDETIGFTRDYSVEDLYKYVNTVRPVPIRVDSDEVTYNFHIYLRYTIEKKLIGGELSVDEVPQVWNDMMEELLGIRPRNDAEGVLQDIHWSHGSIGYFPTYTLGNVVSAQIKYTIIDGELGGLATLLEEGSKGIARIQEILREKIHRWGKVYPPKELVARATGEEINPEYFNKYLAEKYLNPPTL